MRRFINPLLLMTAHANQSDLIRQLQYLREENRILRSRLPRQIRLTPQERERLLRYARCLGRAIYQLVSIVHPHTMRRWLRGMSNGSGRRRQGRPRTAAEIEQIVLRIARQTGWGYCRILGELKKLNIRNISRSTVVNILKRAGLGPSPQRKQSTWDEFIKRHAQTLWACDFFSRKVLTGKGWREAYVLVFINLKSRMAWISPSVFSPSQQWTMEQAATFLRAFEKSEHRPAFLIHDRDSKFGEPFRLTMHHHKVQPVRIAICCPNMNAYAERFIQTLQQECLDHFVVFGRGHLDHLLSQFLDHYHAERPHQALGNRPLNVSRLGDEQTDDDGEILCRRRLGGLLRHYYRKAA